MGTLLVLSWIAAFACNIWLVVRAFGTSSKWGVCVLLLSPVAAFLYAANHWEKAKKPFLLYLGFCVAAGFIFGSMILSVAGGDTTPNGAPVAEQTGLTDEERARLNILEKTVDLMGKFAKGEKDHQVIAAMRAYVGYAKSGGNNGKRNHAIQSITTVLDRSDLTSSERKSLTQMLHEVEATTGTAEPLHSDPPEASQVAYNPQTRPQSSKGTLPKEDPKGLSDTYRGKPVGDPEPIEPDIPEETVFHEPSLKTIPPDQAKNYIGSRVVVIEDSGNEQNTFLSGFSGDFIEFENRSEMGSISFSLKRSEIRSLKVYQ